MTCATCPNCGHDIEPLADFRLGDLQVERSAMSILWRWQHVTLTCTQRLMVAALAQADGEIIRKPVLAEITGYEGDDPENIVDVGLTRIRRAFRLVDPEFDMIETIWGQGLRWKTEEVVR